MHRSPAIGIELSPAEDVRTLARRTVLKRAAAIAGGSAIGLLLDACGGSATPTAPPAATVAASPTTAGATATRAAGMVTSGTAATTAAESPAEIKNVVTAAAKAHHYWTEHALADTERLAV